MKSWYSPSELAGLPGLPATERAIQIRAKREDWASQPRPGRGGGREYALKNLPTQTRRHLLAAAANLPVPAQSPPPQATAPACPAVASLPEAASLKGWQRRRMEARLAILMEIDRIGAVLGTECAIRTLCEQAAAGELAPELQQMVPVANARSGGADGKRALSRRTLYRWLTERGRGNTALAPRPTDHHEVPAWAPALLGLYQRPTKPSLVWALEQLPEHLPSGVEPPSYWVAHRFLKRMGNVEIERGRMGPRALRNIQPFRRRSTAELWPADIYSADGHTFDAEVRHPVHGRPFRPEMTGVIDVATRRLVGWSIALSESGWAVLDALRHACLTGGIPCIFYVDNGSGYCNTLMDDVAIGLLARLAITKQTSIPYNSQARGLIERLHQSLWVRAAKELPTYMGADMDQEARQRVYKLTRKEVRSPGASRFLMPFQQFCQWAEEQVGAYNARPHRGLPRVRDEQSGKLRHQSPNEAWASAVANGWEPAAVAPAEADDLFHPYQVRKTVRGEVNLFGNTYFHQALADYTGDLVRVGYCIHDASRVWVRDRNDRLLCVAEFEANKSSYFPVSAIEEAAARRAKGRRERAERALEEIDAEHAGILGALPAAAAPSPQQRADANAMLERLRATAHERQSSQKAEQAEQAAAATEQPARLPEPPSTPARPDLGSDFELWLWVQDHPDAATEQDRTYLEQALAESPALRAQVDAELAKRARRS